MILARVLSKIYKKENDGIILIMQKVKNIFVVIQERIILSH